MTASLVPASPPYIDAYGALGVAPGVSRDGIKLAYKNELAKLRQANLDPVELDDKLQIITEAYSILSNDSRRSSYDATFIPAVSPPTSRPSTPSFGCHRPKTPSTSSMNRLHSREQSWDRAAIESAGGEKLMGLNPSYRGRFRRDYTVHEPEDQEEEVAEHRDWSSAGDYPSPRRENGSESQTGHFDDRPMRGQHPSSSIGEHSLGLEERLHSLMLGNDRHWTALPSPPLEQPEPHQPSRRSSAQNPRARRHSIDDWATGQPPADIFGPTPWGDRIEGEMRNGPSRQLSARTNEGEKRSNGDYHVKKTEHHLTHDADGTIRFSSVTVASRYISGKPHRSSQGAVPQRVASPVPRRSQKPESFNTYRPSASDYQPSTTVGSWDRPRASTPPLRPLSPLIRSSSPAPLSRSSTLLALPSPASSLALPSSQSTKQKLLPYHGSEGSGSAPYGSNTPSNGRISSPAMTSLVQRPASPAMSNISSSSDLTKRALMSPAAQKGGLQLTRRDNERGLVRSASIGTGGREGRW